MKAYLASSRTIDSKIFETAREILSSHYKLEWQIGKWTGHEQLLKCDIFFFILNKEFKTGKGVYSQYETAVKAGMKVFAITHVSETELKTGIVTLDFIEDINWQDSYAGYEVEENGVILAKPKTRYLLMKNYFS